MDQRALDFDQLRRLGEEGPKRFSEVEWPRPFFGLLPDGLTRFWEEAWPSLTNAHFLGWPHWYIRGSAMAI